MGEVTIDRPVGSGLLTQAPGLSVAWWADWRTATGQTNTAYLDGGKFTGFVGDPDFVPDPGGDNKANREYGRVLAAPAGFPAGMTNVFQYEIPDFRDPDPQPGLQVVAKDQWTLPAVGEYQFMRWYGMLDAPDGHNPADQHFFHLGKDAEGDDYESTFQLNAQESDGLFITGGRYRVQLLTNWQSTSMGARLGYLNILLNVGTVYEFQLRQHRLTSTELRYTMRVWEVGGAELTGGAFIWEAYNDSPNPASLDDFEVVVANPVSHFQVIEIGYNGSSPTGVFTPVPKHNIGGVAIRVTPNAAGWLESYPISGVED